MAEIMDHHAKMGYVHQLNSQVVRFQHAHQAGYNKRRIESRHHSQHCHSVDTIEEIVREVRERVHVELAVTEGGGKTKRRIIWGRRRRMGY